MIFELAILRLLEKHRRSSVHDEQSCARSLAVYMAPTRVSQSCSYTTSSLTAASHQALCYERFVDWQNKFGSRGLTVVMITGDSDGWKDFYAQSRKADIIVTTVSLRALAQAAFPLTPAQPEKWDSVTRRSKERSPVLSRLGLMMIDEVRMRPTSVSQF